ncbi:proteasome assembly chaperone 3 [Rhineura floridana]|uniref:proteasome assembly chaperone 3 n=1 Tax=Rhineura floridana TaxID=261503 RepID=UPI002AC85A7E|nr:proteasome assembly chaperone 3 [Rhineura floridana]XP_061455762.1 proteasome assembly chaperone 3 [Rhineura floridana]XP_061455763.1 proteasome assembly chaperone 3 [Rhineura floridana]XP_061455764.1 proteasome assembly chaperone 3 [Rhineura floridana]XP_061455766.1 proteasome assembly chaperone 3 [Rhineura floridana]
MAAKPILDSKQAEEVVQGIPTEVVCTAFANTILVVVTQYRKMGTLVSVEPSVVADGISRPLLTTKVLLGKDEPLVHICAKHLVMSVSQEAGNKPVLLAIALKDRSIEGIRTLQDMIRRCRVW